MLRRRMMNVENGATTQNNIITYEASAKLTETTTTNTAGLHTNRFGSATILSHTWADGVGEIVFDKDVTEIGEQAFFKCTNLTSIIIPNSVTAFTGYYAFFQTGLVSITLPEHMTNFGQYPFYYCTKLESIVIPQGVTVLNLEAFSNCYKLSHVVLPNSLNRLGGSSFLNCRALNEIIIPSSVTAIASKTFYGCSNLTSVTIEKTTPPTLENVNAFQSTNANIKFYVPASSVDTYKAASGWSDYASSIQAIPT